MNNIYSFDVFDTCITRKYYHPHDLFLDLAQNILNLERSPFSEKKITQLAKKRQDAEIFSRKSSSKDDILITDIYNELKRDKNITVDLESMMLLELSLEVENIIPVPRMLQLYNELKSNNHRVIFVSDMYLPQQIVLEMLNSCGYKVQPEELYLSGELGLSKRTGKLYQYILTQENVKPGNLIHYGDNVYSDIKKATKLGINTNYVSDIHRTNCYDQVFLHRANIWQNFSYELQKKLRIYRYFYKNPLSTLSIEKQISISKTTSIARLIRLESNANHDTQSLDIISAYIAAPLFTSFVFWTLNKAKLKGIKRLYFIARNGQIFYKIAKIISNSFAYDIECHYLYGSRLAWYPAKFTRVDDQFIDMVQKKYAQCSIFQILLDFRFIEQEIMELINCMGISLDSIKKTSEPEELYNFFFSIKNSQLNQFFERKFIECKINIGNYFKSEGLFDEISIGIVDIGWRLSAHNALYEIMKEHSSRGFTGFYFGVSNEHEKVSSKTPFYSYITNVNNKKNNWLFKLGSMMILEEVFSAADHGSTIGYLSKNDGSLPLLNKSHADNYTNTIRKIQSNILKFVELISHDKNDIESIKDEALNVFEKFYKYPINSEVAVISNVNVYAMTSHSIGQKRILAHKISSSELLMIIRNVLFYNRNIKPEWVWFQGSLSISKNCISKVGRVLSFLESLLLRLIKSN